MFLSLEKRPHINEAWTRLHLLSPTLVGQCVGVSVCGCVSEWVGKVSRFRTTLVSLFALLNSSLPATGQNYSNECRICVQNFLSHLLIFEEMNFDGWSNIISTKVDVIFVTSITGSESVKFPISWRISLEFLVNPGGKSIMM